MNYVALGDSYTSGPLLQPQLDAAGGCFRSRVNYPSLLARKWRPASYADVSCSGAETRNLWQPQITFFDDRRWRPQLAALSRRTTLVTLTIGGNDFGLFGSMIGTCVRVARQNRSGSPCRDAFTVAGIDTKLADARAIRVNVIRALRAIRQRAPRAEVYLIGYPRVLPESGTCRQAGLATGDYPWVRRVAETLNHSLRRAAGQAGVRYVDTYPASRGHDICAGNQAWIKGKSFRLVDVAPFHPFARGMRGIAKVVDRAVAEGRYP